MNESIASHIPSCADDGNWDDVTVENTLDMSTGNRNLNTFWGDENSLAMNGLFLSTTSAKKTNFSCTEWQREYTPGKDSVHHISDTYLVGVALHDDFGQDPFQNIIVNDIWAPIGVSESSFVSRKTEGANVETFPGWGLTLKRDDIVKIANFYNLDNGNNLLDNAELDAAMGRNLSDVGLPASTGDPRYYNNGFWNYRIESEVWCNNPGQDISFFSGYGGITVLMMPNGTTYYYFSDGDDSEWMDAVEESNYIRDFCTN